MGIPCCNTCLVDMIPLRPHESRWQAGVQLSGAGHADALERQPTAPGSQAASCCPLVPQLCQGRCERRRSSAIEHTGPTLLLEGLGAACDPAFKAKEQLCLKISELRVQL